MISIEDITREEFESYEKSQRTLPNLNGTTPCPLSWSRYEMSEIDSAEKYIFIFDNYELLKERFENE